MGNTQSRAPQLVQLLDGKRMELSRGVKNLQVVRQLIERIAVNDPSLTDTERELQSNAVGGEGAVALAQALKTNTTLIELDLSINGVGVKGAVALAQALMTNTTLIELDLSYNLVRDEGAVALAQALKTNTTLIELDLSYNQVGEEGADALAQALKTNTTLIELDLIDNEVGEEGAVALAQALKTNTTLIELDLSYNRVGGKGAHALAQALSENETLTVLELQGNREGPEGIDALDKALFRIETFKALNGRIVDEDSLRNFFSERFLDQVDMGDVWKMEQGMRETSLISLRVASVGHIKTPEQLSCLLSTSTMLRVLALNKDLVTEDSQFDELPGEIGCLTSLQHLLVTSSPCLVRVDPGIGSLFCLQSLSFQDCWMLTDLPEEMGRLTSLQSLSLRGCSSLQSIPSSIHRLSRLHRLDLGGTRSLHTPPRLIIQGGLLAIQQYLRDVERKSTYACRKKKVVLLGDSGHGKSSLLDSLIAQTARRRDESDRTVGVDVRAITENNMSMVFYDFAGQEVYQATHGLFMSEGSLCILVVRHGLEFEENVDGILRWLETIESYMSSSVVLLVWTHLDHWGSWDNQDLLDRQDAEKKANDWVVSVMKEVESRLSEGRQEQLEQYERWAGIVDRKCGDISSSPGTIIDSAKEKAREWRKSAKEAQDALQETHTRRATWMQCIFPVVHSTARAHLSQCAETLIQDESRIKKIEDNLERLEHVLIPAMDPAETEKLQRMQRIRRLLTSTPKVLGNINVCCSVIDTSFGAVRKVLAEIAQQSDLFIDLKSKVPLDYLMLEELCRTPAQPTTLSTRNSAEEIPEGRPVSAGIDQEPRWLPWDEALSAHIQEKSSEKLREVMSRPYVSFEDLADTVSLDPCKMSRDTLLGALRYLHNTGSVLCHGLDNGEISRSGSPVDRSVESLPLKVVVFLQPQWIIDAVTCVVREKEASGLNDKFREIQSELKRNGHLCSHLEEYLKTGRLSETLLRKGLWRRNGMSEEDKDVLIDLLTSEHFRILRHCRGPSWTEEEWFVVPSMIGTALLPKEHRQGPGLPNQSKMITARVSGPIPGRLFSEFQTFIKTETGHGGHEVDLVQAALLDRRDGSVLSWTYGEPGEQVNETLVVLCDQRRMIGTSQRVAVQDIRLHARGEAVSWGSGMCCWKLVSEAMRVLKGVVSRFEGLTLEFLSIGQDQEEQILNENRDLYPTRIMVDSNRICQQMGTGSDRRTVGVFLAMGGGIDVNLEGQSVQRECLEAAGLWNMACNPKPLFSDLMLTLEKAESIEPPLRAILLAGHGTRNQGWSQNPGSFIWNSASRNGVEPHSNEEMAERMAPHAKKIELVFLNACHTLKLGAMLQERKFGYVVCWEGKVRDSLASRLSRYFWREVFRVQRVDDLCYSEVFQTAIQSIEKDHPVQKSVRGMPCAEKLSGDEDQGPDEDDRQQQTSGEEDEPPVPLVSAHRGGPFTRPKPQDLIPSTEPEGELNKVILLFPFQSSDPPRRIEHVFETWELRAGVHWKRA